MSRVSLESVVKRYGEVPVIHGLDLEIEEGEFCVFVGPPAAESPPCCGWSPASRRRRAGASASVTGT